MAPPPTTTPHLSTMKQVSTFDNEESFTSNNRFGELVENNIESFKICYSTSSLLTSCPAGSTMEEKRPTPQESLWEKALRRLEDMGTEEALEPSDSQARRKELLLNILHAEMLTWRYYVPVD